MKHLKISGETISTIVGNLHHDPKSQRSFALNLKGEFIKIPGLLDDAHKLAWDISRGIKEKNQEYTPNIIKESLTKIFLGEIFEHSAERKLRVKKAAIKGRQVEEEYDKHKVKTIVSNGDISKNRKIVLLLVLIGNQSKVAKIINAQFQYVKDVKKRMLQKIILGKYNVADKKIWQLDLPVEMANIDYAAAKKLWENGMAKPKYDDIMENFAAYAEQYLLQE